MVAPWTTAAIRYGDLPPIVVPEEVRKAYRATKTKVFRGVEMTALAATKLEINMNEPATARLPPAPSPVPAKVVPA
jgi:hypothetical protein